MKVGSIVECVNPFCGNWYMLPIPAGHYVVRGIITVEGDTIPGVYVEEIINEKQYCAGPAWTSIFMEPTYCSTRFREIEFPPALEIEISELLKEPQYA